MRRSLRTQLTFLFLSVAIVPLLLIAIVGIQQSLSTQITQSVNQQNEIAQRVALDVENFIQGAEDGLRIIAATNETQTMSDQEANTLLTNLLSFSDIYENIALVDKRGRELIKVSRSTISGQIILNDIKGTPEFNRPLETGQTYYSDLYFDPISGEPLINIAIPLINLTSGEVHSVIVSTLRFKTVWEIMAQSSTGDTTIFMTSLDDLVVAHPNSSVVLSQSSFARPSQGELGTGLAGESAVLGIAPVHVGGNVDETFYVITELPVTVALAPSINFATAAIILLIVTIVVISIFSIWQTRQFSRPIEELASTARNFAEGNLDSRVTIEAENEIGALGNTFNQMAEQLRETLTNLEKRVAARTKDLQTVAHISTTTATILEENRLLQEVVDLSRDRFGLYHAHIYLLNETGDILELKAGAGEAGRIMAAEKRSIPLDREQSLVARCARERKGVVVNDVTQAPDFLPNPLLPETRAEMAVPMISGDILVGVLDVQSEKIGRFTEDDISVKTTLAAQVASSLQNVRQFERSRAQAELESLANTIGQKIQRAGTVEEVLQTAIRELGIAVGAQRVSARLGGKTTDMSEN